MKVEFYQTVDDELLKFAVIVASYQDKYVLCKHKQRDTLEIPGGHREENEDILVTAKRELVEETGALDFEIEPVCVYSVAGKNRVNQTDDKMYGLLCFAKINQLDDKIDSEMEKIYLVDKLPNNLTYPLIQPHLFEKAINYPKEKKIQEWFNSWFDCKWNNFENIFAENIYYSESYGPEYHGLLEIKEWFKTWHHNFHLNNWEIKSFIHSQDITIVEWYFSCSSKTSKSAFDGVSLIKWNEKNKIIELKEFASTLPKYDPIKAH